MMGDAGLFLVSVRFKSKPDLALAFSSAMAANAAESLKSEPGCLLFEVHDRGTDLFLYEVYRDQAAFDLHLKSAHYLAFAAMTKDWVADKEVNSFGWCPFAAQSAEAVSK